MARDGAGEGTLILTDDQTVGRGRRGNTWLSTPGNLYMSIILRSKVSLKDAGQLSFLSAVALVDTLTDVVGDTVAIQQKWPNDVLIEGQKCAGILLEAEAEGSKTDWVVLGMGVNLADSPEGAASIAQYTDAPTPRDFIDRFEPHFTALYENWQKAGFQAVRDKWMSKARSLNEQISVRLPKEELSGIFRGIDEAGQLCLEHDGKITKVASGDVFFG